MNLELLRLDASGSVNLPKQAKRVVLLKDMYAMARMYFLQWALALCRLANKVSALC